MFDYHPYLLSCRASTEAKKIWPFFSVLLTDKITDKFNE